MNISQKHPASITDKNVFVRGSDVIFNVQIHDPSSYLKTADAVDFIWDFRDGNQLVTHSNVATHAYNTLGNVTVKLLVEASFRVPCPPPTPTPMHFTQAHTMGNLINTGTLLSQTIIQARHIIFIIIHQDKMCPFISWSKANLCLKLLSC